MEEQQRDTSVAQEWWSEIDAADRAMKPWVEWWQANLDAYSPKVTRSPKTYGEEINTNRDFTLVEQKRAQLFFQTPDVMIKPAPLMMEQPDVLMTHQYLINELLGPDRVDAINMVDAALFDLLCTAGFGVTKMGYESVTQTVQQPMPIPDPQTGAPAIDPLTQQPMTIMQDVPVPIWERIYWDRVSPKKLIIPADFQSTEYDRAPWLGLRFSMTLAEAKQKFGDAIPEDFEASAGSSSADLTFDHGISKADLGKPVEGVEIWYRASLKDPAVLNPDVIRQLVLIKGIEDPVVHKDSPYQEINPKTGRLTAQSLTGYPIHILVTRAMTDSAYVMSDCSVSRPQVNELNKFREQQIKLRDSNIPIRVFDVDRLPPDAAEKIRNAEYGSAPIGLPSECFAGNAAIVEISKATYPRENFTFEDKQDADIARTHAMDSNQAGIQNETARTATELQLVQANSNVRLEKERSKVLQWYCNGVTKFSSLVQRFLSLEQAAEIVGPQRAQQWAQVMKQVPATLAFTASPDSALRVDGAQKRKIAIETYSFLRNDPRLNPDALLKESVLPALGLDSRSVAPPPQPQPPQPEPPRVSLSINGQDLIPFAPQYPAMLLVLKASGMDVSQLPQPQAPPPQMNAGPVQPDLGMMKPQQNTGGMQGSPFKAPIAAGGQGMRSEMDGGD